MKYSLSSFKFGIQESLFLRMNLRISTLPTPVDACFCGRMIYIYIQNEKECSTGASAIKLHVLILSFTSSVSVAITFIPLLCLQPVKIRKCQFI